MNMPPAGQRDRKSRVRRLITFSYCACRNLSGSKSLLRRQGSRGVLGHIRCHLESKPRHQDGHAVEVVQPPVLRTTAQGHWGRTKEHHPVPEELSSSLCPRPARGPRQDQGRGQPDEEGREEDWSNLAEVSTAGEAYPWTVDLKIESVENRNVVEWKVGIYVIK